MVGSSDEAYEFSVKILGLDGIFVKGEDDEWGWVDSY